MRLRYFILMRLDTVKRTLVGVSLVCGLWALILALSGGGAIYLGSLRLSSSSARNPLLLALASGLLAWALALTTDRESRHRHQGPMFVTVLALLAIGLNVMLQAQPAPPNEFTCYYDQPLRGGFRFQMNCDAMEFMTLAKDPSRVLTQPIRQGRPLSFAIPALIALPLGALPDVDVLPIGPPFQQEYLAFVLVNVATLVCALLFFTWAYERGTGRRGGPEWLFVMVILAANEITKMFIWNPHVQIFNLLTPCLAIYLSLRLLERGAPLSFRLALSLGLAMGIGLLEYGSFVVPLLCIIVIHWFVYRRVWHGLIVGGAASLVYLTWVAFVRLQTGTFYNHEVEQYRQFVWIVDCIRAGTCRETIGGHYVAFFNATAPIIVVPTLLAAGFRIARALSINNDNAPMPRALLQACAITWVVTFVFLALAGFYSPRLSWLLVPPMLMLVAIEARALWDTLPTRRPWAISIALATVCMGYVLLLASRQGPFW